MSESDTQRTTAGVNVDEDEAEIGEIEDVEDLKQRRKLQSLLDAEETVREMRKEAKLGERQGTSVGVVGYRTAVEDYLLALRPVIKNHDRELWEAQQLGSLTIQPPSPREFFSHLPDSEVNEDGTPRFGTVHGLQSLEPRTVAEFEGLRSLLDAQSRFSTTWAVQFQPASGGNKTLTRTKSVDLPREIVDNAFEYASDFADEHGFGFDTTEDDGDAGFDYSDLLTEDPEADTPEDGIGGESP